MTELCLSTSPIKVLSSDGVQFQLTREALPVSQVLYSMIPLDADVDENIPLPNVHSSILERVIEFMHYYAAHPIDRIPQPIPWPKRLPDVVTPSYYCHFILTLSYMDLLLLLSAADYLHIQPLIELCCARLARLLINKTPSEVIALMRISEENRTGSGTTIATTENSDKSSGEAPELQNQTQTQMSGRGRGRGRALRPQNITLTLTQDEIQQMLETFMWTTGAGSGNGSTATVNTGTAAWGPGDTATYVDVDYDSNDPQLDRSEAANEEEAEPAEMIAAMHEQRAAYLQEQQLRHFEHEHRNAPEGTAAIAIPSSVFKPVV